MTFGSAVNFCHFHHTKISFLLPATFDCVSTKNLLCWIVFPTNFYFSFSLFLSSLQKHHSIRELKRLSFTKKTKFCFWNLYAKQSVHFRKQKWNLKKQKQKKILSLRFVCCTCTMSVQVFLTLPLFLMCYGEKNYAKKGKMKTNLNHSCYRVKFEFYGKLSDYVMKMGMEAHEFILFDIVSILKWSVVTCKMTTMQWGTATESEQENVKNNAFVTYSFELILQIFVPWWWRLRVCQIAYFQSYFLHWDWKV